MVMLGALLDKHPILTLTENKAALEAHMPESHKKFLKSNLEALSLSAAFARKEHA
jgi:hypothetical protein